MYKSDPLLMNTFNERVQHPSPLIYITRNKTSITSQRLWEKKLITSTVGTRSSIAVRRPFGSFTADMIFTAQVENGTAVIRYAETHPNINRMRWNVLTTIPNVLELSIMFDGFMEKVDNKIESYTIGDYPNVFYVSNNNLLKGLNLNTQNVYDISDSAYNVASVRGLYSKLSGLDDGIFVFYTNELGQLWEARILSNVVVELNQIENKPVGVTGWVDVWASLSFDYRVILQLLGNDGQVYTLVSSSRPSGFVLVEYLSFGTRMTSGFIGYCGSKPAEVIFVYNTPDNPNSIYIEFDSEPFIFDAYIRGIWIQGSDGNKSYPIGIIKHNNRSVSLEFSSILGTLGKPHRLMNDNNIICIGNYEGDVSTSFGQEVFLFGADYRHTGYEYLEYKTLIYSGFEGQILKAFDGKAYTPNEYLQCKTTVNTNFSGSTYLIIKNSGYAPNEYLQCKTIMNTNFSGGMFDTSGNPI